MKLTNSEYTTITTIFENRGYRYFDTNEIIVEEYNIWKNTQYRILNGTQGSSQRFTKEQKSYIVDMVDEYQNNNIEDLNGIEYKDCTKIINKLRVG